MVEYLGLLFEFLFLGIGVYLYLFARGLLKAGNPELQKRAEAFRQANGWWLRLLALAIVAIMVLNIYLHLRQLFSGS
ncbi:MAG: hypothetical protein IPL49_15230 [Saprospirales bacterium]|nr:hypothetical protein [Saprospirales bacterium]MBK8492189.1 hypothetical protein [Saprospirales bacterium]